MPTALIADDERLMREQLRARLSQVWPELEIVAEARNGQEAVSLTEQHRPDVVFLDIRMPVLTGVDADLPAGVTITHAATLRDGDRLLATGGRVLGVTALGNNIAQAKLQAYTAVKRIRWDGAWCRKDISDKAAVRS